MSFIMAELIKKKKAGQPHTPEEISFLVERYTCGEIPDYQMSAWLMAVCFQGMDEFETAALTEMMMLSGEVLDFSGLDVMAVDKHSTGGIGDKTSLILAPLAAAAGIPVPMIAGRGLGHTGGTLDKLEAIPGFRVQPDLAQFKQQVQSVGCAIIGQTDSICPADKKLYALRDVTGTVDSIPLICASIMSKKLAEGVGGLVLDVKYGSGAFMKDLKQAQALAGNLVQIGHHHRRKILALVTNMNQPLGRFAGNACEVQECLDIMMGKPVAADTLELTLSLAEQMLLLAGVCREASVARAKCEQLLSSGAVLEKFYQICSAQGAAKNWKLPEAKAEAFFCCASDGFVDFLDVEAIGFAAIELGAGRRQSGDRIDPTAGLEFFKKQGASASKGEPLIRLFASHEKGFSAATKRLESAIRISTESADAGPLVADTILPKGGNHGAGRT